VEQITRYLRRVPETDIYPAAKPIFDASGYILANDI